MSINNTEVFLDPVLLAESEQQSGEDVVRAHHQRNGFPRAPSPGRLRAIRGQQQVSAGIAVPMIEETAGPQPSQVVATDGALEGHPTKLRSYPFGFRAVIERAKLIAQCDCATKSPFPPRSTFLDISSTEIFSEALLGCENVPAGKFIFSRLAVTD